MDHLRELGVDGMLLKVTIKWDVDHVALDRYHLRTVVKLEVPK
jgi:hypothetical protein